MQMEFFGCRPIYGFIFLFKWIEERRSRRKIQPLEEMFVEDEEVIRDIFFAQQVLKLIILTTEYALVFFKIQCITFF